MIALDLGVKLSGKGQWRLKGLCWAILLFMGKMLFLKSSRGVGGEGKSGRDDGLPMNL